MGFQNIIKLLTLYKVKSNYISLKKKKKMNKAMRYKHCI